MTFRRFGRLWPVLALALPTGCVAFQDTAVASRPTNLPLQAPLWTECRVEGPNVGAALQVVDAAGVCGPTAPTRPGRHLAIVVEETVSSSDALDLVSGLTLTTFPAFRWYALRVRGDVVEEGGAVVATAERTSSIGVVIGWPLVVALPHWLGGAHDRLTHANVRAITRAVVSELVLLDGQLPARVRAEDAGPITEGPALVVPPATGGD